MVLDASASMGAVVDGEALRDRAVAEVRDRSEKLPRRSRVTLVQKRWALPGPALDSTTPFSLRIVSIVRTVL